MAGAAALGQAAAPARKFAIVRNQREPAAGIPGGRALVRLAKTHTRVKG